MSWHFFALPSLDQLALAMLLITMHAHQSLQRSTSYIAVYARAHCSLTCSSIVVPRKQVPGLVLVIDQSLLRGAQLLISSDLFPSLL